MKHVFVAAFWVVLSAACGDNQKAAIAADAAPQDAEALAVFDAALPDASPQSACDEKELVESLLAIPGMVAAVEEECDGIASARCFALQFTQPIEHAAPSAVFVQRMQLIHRGCDRPTIIADWGYELFPVYYESELGELFGGNSINVEHRFQGQSIPDELNWDWSSLTIANGAADQHAVITALRGLYSGRWISTGASKGGVTALYHYYLYPDDLDGTVPYVAPASRAREDNLYQAHMAETLPECNRAVKAVQTAALTTRRNAALVLLEAQFGGAAQEILEQAVQSFDWGFWQWQGVADCAAVPTADATDQEFLDYLFAGWFSEPGSGSNSDWRSDFALVYEWLTEQGFADQINGEVRELLTIPVLTMEQSFAMGVGEVSLPAYDGTLTAAMRAWTPSAESVVLIYGEFDPWSGGMVDAPSSASSGLYVAPGGTHTAGLVDLLEPDRAAAIARISAMLKQAPLRKTAKRTANLAAIHERKMFERMRRLRLVVPTP